MTDFCTTVLPYLVGAVLTPLAVVRGWDFARSIIAT